MQTGYGSWFQQEARCRLRRLAKLGISGHQANIAAEFLDLARKERQLGKRTLIDVLAGETNLINAQSDATSAQSDVIIAGLTLLSVMGQLSVEVVSVIDAKVPGKN